MVQINEITMIIPTHERKAYLLRSISYFANVNILVMYVDSSQEKLECQTLPKNVKYYHLPGAKFSEKALYALSKVKTDLVAFCADDDFVVPSTIKKAQDYLKDNHNSSAVVGRYLAFDEGGIELYYTQPYQNYSDVSKIDSENVINYMSNYHQILWAVYRAPLLVNAYEIVEECQFSNDNFIELTIASIMSSSGGIKVLDDIMGVREVSVSDHWGKRHKNIAQAFQDRDKKVMIDIDEFVEKSSSYIPRELAFLSIDNYIQSNSSNSRAILKKIVPRCFRIFFSRCKSRMYRKYVSPDTELKLIQNELVKFNATK